MEMDPLTKTHQIPLFEPSFPLFNIDLLKQSNVELFIPDLLSLDKISEKIRVKMQQDINLNGDFELFEKKEKKKLLKSSRPNKHSMRAKNLKQGTQAATSLEQKSHLQSLKLKRTGKKPFKTALSHHHLCQNSSPNKRARDSLKTEATEPRPFPSLASILGDEESSDDDLEYPHGAIRGNTVKTETEEKPESIFRFDLFGKTNSHKDFILEENATFEKTLEPFSCDVSIFSQLFTETNQFQSKVQRGCNKKVKENPRGLDGNFQSYKIFGNISGNKKMGSFDLAMEKEAVTKSFSVPLDIRLEENVALALDNNIVLTK